MSACVCSSFILLPYLPSSPFLSPIRFRHITLSHSSILSLLRPSFLLHVTPIQFSVRIFPLSRFTSVYSFLFLFLSFSLPLLLATLSLVLCYSCPISSHSVLYVLRTSPLVCEGRAESSWLEQYGGDQDGGALKRDPS